MGDMRNPRGQQDCGTNTDDEIRVIVCDFINHKLHQHSGIVRREPSNETLTPVMLTLREMGDEFEEKYRTALDQMIDQLHEYDMTTHNTFLGVVNELFSEGITWGRIVAMFAFAGGLAVQRATEDGTDVQGVIDDLTHYIQQNIKTWINDQGGWKAFVEFYNSEDANRTSWNGLKKVFCGIAAGAVGALTIGALLASKT